MGEIMIQDLSDMALAAEWHKWNDYIKNVTRWGAALAAADGFRKECENEILKRKLYVEGFESSRPE